MRLKADGDQREVAWAEFCERYEPVIAAFARRVGWSAAEVPDLVQQVLLGFFSAQPRFVYRPEAGRFRGYLKTCVVHEIQRIRTSSAARARRERERPLPDGVSEDELWDREWEAQQLERALARTRDRYTKAGNAKTFEAFHRVAVLGHDPAAVAADLGLSRDSVYQAKSRLLAQLRVEMQAVADEMGD